MATQFLTDPIEIARHNMVEQQIRPWDVLDPNVLAALYQIKREAFVPASQQHLAFFDMDTPLVDGQVMLSPKLQARLVQELNLEPEDQVLEIGTGTGYTAALISQLAHTVTTIESNANLAAQAKANLAKAGIQNVVIMEGDGLAENGLWHRQQFDAILISGSLPSVPDHLFEMLKPNGRLVAIVGQPPIMQAIVYTKQGTSIAETSLFDTVAPMLLGASVPSSFSF
jgi:protein-L-isoaspartate(D-aspartate) O-methyltransferase